MIEFTTGLVIGVCIGMFIMGVLAAEKRQSEIRQLKKNHSGITPLLSPLLG